MPTDLQSFVALLIAVVAIGAAAGVGFQRGKIGRLQNEVKEERERRQAMAADLADARSDALQLRSDLEALGRAIRGEAHWTALEDTLDAHDKALAEHDKAARAHWLAEHRLLVRLVRHVERIAE